MEYLNKNLKINFLINSNLLYCKSTLKIETDEIIEDLTWFIHNKLFSFELDLQNRIVEIDNNSTVFINLDKIFTKYNYPEYKEYFQSLTSFDIIIAKNIIVANTHSIFGDKFEGEIVNLLRNDFGKLFRFVGGFGSILEDKTNYVTIKGLW